MPFLPQLTYRASTPGGAETPLGRRNVEMQACASELQWLGIRFREDSFFNLSVGSLAPLRDRGGKVLGLREGCARDSGRLSADFYLRPPPG